MECEFDNYVHLVLRLSIRAFILARRMCLRGLRKYNFDFVYFVSEKESCTVI
jgi:hypothetical protein